MEGDHFLALLPWGQSLKMAEMKRRVGWEEAEANFEGGCYEKRGLGNRKDRKRERGRGLMGSSPLCHRKERKDGGKQSGKYQNSDWEER